MKGHWEKVEKRDVEAKKNAARTFKRQGDREGQAYSRNKHLAAKAKIVEMLSENYHKKIV